MSRASFDSASTAHESTQYIYKPPMEMPFEPDRYRDAEIHSVCGSYAYALGLPQIGMKVPRQLNMNLISEYPLPELDADKIRGMFMCDGIDHIDPACVPDSDDYILAVRYGNNFENGKPGMIVMCRHPGGQWSYKHDFGFEACNQKRRILDVDFSGNPITDPATADFKGLTEFGGYYTIPYEGIHFKPSVGINPRHGFGNYPVQEPNFF